jgi:hypothetical protein
MNFLNCKKFAHVLKIVLVRLRTVFTSFFFLLIRRESMFQELTSPALALPTVIFIAYSNLKMITLTNDWYNIRGLVYKKFNIWNQFQQNTVYNILRPRIT